MRKLALAMSALVAFTLAACSQPSVEDQFFQELENAVAEMESLAEQERVCMSEVADRSEEHEENLRPLAEELEEKHGPELPREHQQRMQRVSERMQSLAADLMPKIDLNC